MIKENNKHNKPFGALMLSVRQALPWEYPLEPSARVSPKPLHRMIIGWYTSGFK